MQKLALLLREDKPGGSDKQEQGRNVVLHFVDLSSEQEVQQSLLELKAQLC